MKFLRDNDAKLALVGRKTLYDKIYKQLEQKACFIRVGVERSSKWTIAPKFIDRLKEGNFEWKRTPNVYLGLAYFPRNFGDQLSALILKVFAKCEMTTEEICRVVF